MPKNQRPPRRRAAPPPGPREWVGGRISSPFYVTETTPFRPEMILWIELPAGIVVHFELLDPSQGPVAFGDTLRRAIESPQMGPPRQPLAVRVAEAELAREVQRVLPEVEVTVAPTPELNEVLESMAEFAAEAPGEGPSPSYLEGGRCSVSAVEELFRAAQFLYHTAPWKRAGDTQVLRVDIPEFGISGACLSIIGALGENLGFLLFPSYRGFRAFLRSADRPRRPGRPLDLGTTFRALNFEPGSHLPPSMLREVMEHGWAVADPQAFPVATHCDRDGVARPLAERDLRIISECCMALSFFCQRHAELFESPTVLDPICESYGDRPESGARITYPYEAGALFSINDSPDPPRRKRAPKAASPRLQPTPDTPEERLRAAVFELDGKLVEQLLRFAERTLGRTWLVDTTSSFSADPFIVELTGPFLLYQHLVDGITIADRFERQRSVRLPAREEAWLRAQCGAWLSVWEVLEVDPGSSMRIRDLLTEEARIVRETTASRSLRPGHGILARVVDFEGISVIAGMYPRPLAPDDAIAVVGLARGRLRRKTRVPIERMRDTSLGPYLIARWEEAVEEARGRG